MAWKGEHYASVRPCACCLGPEAGVQLVGCLPQSFVAQPTPTPRAVLHNNLNKPAEAALDPASAGARFAVLAGRGRLGPSEGFLEAFRARRRVFAASRVRKARPDRSRAPLPPLLPCRLVGTECCGAACLLLRPTPPGARPPPPRCTASSPRSG